MKPSFPNWSLGTRVSSGACEAPLHRRLLDLRHFKAASKNKFPFLRVGPGGISAENWDVISGCFQEHIIVLFYYTYILSSKLMTLKSQPYP
jgi:hypothetical protein